MTIAQIIKDALTWTRYFAVNNSVGEPEVQRIFYAAYQSTYNQAVISYPEFFTVSAPFSGNSWTIPADFQKEIIFRVTDAGCTSGYVRIADNAQYDIHEANSRNHGTAAAPLGINLGATFGITPAVTGGIVYYIRTYSETDLSDTSQQVTKFLPLVYQPLLLSKMQELIRVRHFRLPETPQEQAKQMAMMTASAKLLHRKLKPLEQIEGISESPMSVEVTQ